MSDLYYDPDDRADRLAAAIDEAEWFDDELWEWASTTRPEQARDVLLAEFYRSERYATLVQDVIDGERTL